MDAAGKPYRNVCQQGMTAFSFCRCKLAAVAADSSTEIAVGLCVGDHVVDGSIHLADQGNVKRKVFALLTTRPGLRHGPKGFTLELDAHKIHC